MTTPSQKVTTKQKKAKERMKKEYKSVLHKQCGGEIVIVSDGKEWIMACRKCLENWTPTLVGYPLSTESLLAEDMEVVS